MGRSIYSFGTIVTALMLLALACDGGGDGSPSPAAQATGTAATTPTEEATSPPGDTDSTPAVIQTPLASPTADASPTAVLTPVPGARLAIPYDSIINYLAEVPDQETERVVCIYDKEMGVVDCEDAGLGLIQLDPPPPAEIEVECSAILLHDELIAVNCKGIDAILAVVYRVE